jgi:hypothetical protein
MPLTFDNLPLDKKNEITIATIEMQFSYPDGTPVADTEYTMKLTTGETRNGKLDGNGKLKETKLPPEAKASITLKGIPLLALAK